MSNYKHQKKHFGIPDATWILGKNYKAVKNRKSRKKKVDISAPNSKEKHNG